MAGVCSAVVFGCENYLKNFKKMPHPIEIHMIFI